LIDESNSNKTVKQISFFPAYDDDSGLSPETFISWFDVYVQTFYPPIFYSPDNVSSYLEDRTNAVQQEDQDVTIIESSTDSLLAGHPAYKLVTRSYSGNETIDTIEYGIIVDDKLYSLSYEVNTSDYQNSLPIANKMIYSFNIESDNLSKSLKLLTNSTGLAMLKEKVPILQGILSSLNSSNFDYNSSKLLNTSEINSSPKTMLENLLKNSSAGNIPNISSMMNSIPPIDLQSICGIELLANLCNGGPFSNPSLNMGNSLLNNESSISGLAEMLNFPKNSTDHFDLSEFKQLLGPFAMLSSPSSSSSSSPSFSDLPFSSSFSSNGTDASFLNQMFLNENNNGTSLNDTKIFNPFEALLGSGGAGNDTGFSFPNNDSFGTDSSNSFMAPNSQDNETLDILRMLEFLQGGSSGR
jgi:hypothetical protein